MELLAELKDFTEREKEKNKSSIHISMNKIYATVDHDLFKSRYIFMLTFMENTIVLNLIGGKYWHYSIKSQYGDSERRLGTEEQNGSRHSI